jgi:hypothetical protein
MSVGRALLLLATASSLLAGCDEHKRGPIERPSRNAEAVKPPPMVLDKLIHFSDPKNCAFDGPFGRLLSSLVTVTDDYRLLPGRPVVPAGYEKAFGRAASRWDGNMLTVSLPVRGTWKGLAVTSVSTSEVAESDVGDTSIYFAAPKSKVIAVLNQAGLMIPPKGSRVDETDVLEFTVGVATEGRTTRFYCG